ncbi:uncharacterized protein LOC110271097 [Arachis ipaensis]|uniref:uncharacterized protein LOC110271097 n=1 Tax=Arachis ipaensis TaxID=130454 RepID=UPI000A2B4143|nr:uncharacterized protein LOC110271097 [Arachis ipaensis]
MSQPKEILQVRGCGAKETEDGSVVSVVVNDGDGDGTKGWGDHNRWIAMGTGVQMKLWDPLMRRWDPVLLEIIVAAAAAEVAVAFGGVIEAEEEVDCGVEGEGFSCPIFKIILPLMCHVCSRNARSSEREPRQTFSLSLTEDI